MNVILLLHKDQSHLLCCIRRIADAPRPFTRSEVIIEVVDSISWSFTNLSLFSALALCLQAAFANRGIWQYRLALRRSTYELLSE